ncbi:hypothetical protein COJ27_26025 [Bacillus cereus]|uniref:hypothetical protein n=1 Tax=Bacillus cereus TaxID=1396 RepID=UPI000BF7C2B5|nr:hypothetical protein [Bacillus cereus]PFL58908.1 hypothetical protein COJ27_26025 [Bacillus cereus]
MNFNFSYFNHPRFQENITRHIAEPIDGGESKTVGIQPEPLYGIISLQVEPLSPLDSYVVVTDIRPGLGQLNVTVRNFHPRVQQIVTFRTVQVPQS